MIGNFSTTIAASDTPQRLYSSSLKVSKVFIQPQRGNTAQVFVGDSSIDSGDSEGFELMLPNSDRAVNHFPLESTKGNEIDLNDIWVAGTQNDVVNVTYWIE